MDAVLFGEVQNFKISSRKLRLTDDDFVDRLNHYYTTLLIVLFSFIICAKQYLVGEPLQCWVPPQFPKAWEQYAENYCWVKNTYFVAPHEPFPKPNDRQDREIQYYQWVPFVLALQAFLFYVPIAVWRTLNWQSGVNIKNTIETLNNNCTLQAKERRKNVSSVAQHLLQVLFNQPNTNLSNWGRIKSAMRADCYLTVVYLLVKVLFLVNIVCQFVLLDQFLGPKYHMYGFNMLRDLWSGLTWKDSGHFPRVTYCDFSIRDVGHTLRPYTVQCVLVVNLFNEKIYIFLWFWLVVLFAVTFFNLLSWTFWLVFPGKKASDVKDMLAKGPGHFNQHLFEFTYAMKRDCLLVMRIVKFNCGEILSRDFAAALYENYCKQNNLKIPREAPATLPRDYLSEPANPPNDGSKKPLTRSKV